MENWELIAKYLAGECTEAEKQELESWLEENTQNSILFQKMNKVWQKSADVSTDFMPNIDAAFHKISQKIDLHPKETKIRTLFPKNHFSRIAAVFVLAVSLFSLIYLSLNVFNSSQLAWTEINAQQDTLLVSLSDGSKIWLKQNSSLRYPKKFNDSIREVFLEGEAFFEVSRDAKKPFLIRSAEASTEVLGTSFQIKAHRWHEEIQVQVLTGQVALYNTKNQKNKVILNPGNLGKFNRQNLQVEKLENSNPNDLAWKTGFIRFDNSPLTEVVQVLSEYYQVKISLVNESQKDCKISVEFENASLEDAIKVIQSTFKSFRLEKSSEGYIIHGKNCR